MALNTSVPAIQFERAGETPALCQLEINGLVARLVVRMQGLSAGVACSARCRSWALPHVAKASFGVDPVGVMYSEGQGVPQNYAEAAKWYRLAADRGDAQPQYNLGLFYAYALTLSGSPASPLAVLDRGFEASEPNRKWIADFTYVWTAEGWLYVAAVIDLFSRRVVGWSMSAGMTAQLVTDALVMAIWRRGKPDALLHHSDRGSQYPPLHKNILCARKERNAKRRRDTAGTLNKNEM